MRRKDVFKALLPILFAMSHIAWAQELSQQPLLVHVGGTMRPAMQEIIRLFEQETGTKVELNYGDSGSIIIAIETSKRGDVCVVHDPFMGQLERKGLVDRGYVVASLFPVIVVRKGNPKQIRGLKDLVRSDVKVGLTDAVYSTGGHIVEVIFRKAGIAQEMSEKDIVRSRAGGEIANAVKIGTVDAGIVWDAVAFARRDALDVIPIDPVVMPDAKVDAVTTATYGPIDMSRTRVTLMTLKTSKQIELARKFADFAASAKGRAVFAKMGFSPAPSQFTGSIFVYCAAGVKTPIEKIAALFEHRTGVKVELTYANSGQLLGQIELTKQGDVYIPGDVGFTQKALEKNLVAGEPREICSLVPVILVRKGNPKSVRDVTDLARPGLRLALTAETAAVGPIQKAIFVKNNVDLEAIRKNTIVSPAVMPDTVLAIKLGTADAAIIWDALSGLAPDETEVIRIPPEKNVIVTTGACVLSVSKNPTAAAAFLDFLTSDVGRAVFKTAGYSVLDSK